MRLLNSSIVSMLRYRFNSHNLYDIYPFIGYKKSRLFGADNMPSEILRILSSENVTANSHNWSITKKVSSLHNSIPNRRFHINIRKLRKKITPRCYSFLNSRCGPQAAKASIIDRETK